MAYCPHCKRDSMANAHIDRCPDNPPVHEAIRAVITNPQDTRYAIGSAAYGRKAKAAGTPAENTLVVHYGSWAAAVETFGLLLASEKPRPKREYEYAKPGRDTEPCPHCGKQFRAGSFVDIHARNCPRRPGIMEAVRVIAEDASNPGVGVETGEYLRRLIVYRETKPEGAPVLPALSTLQGHFGGWDETLHYMGLLTRDEGMDARAAADNARYRAAWQEHHAHELDSWGLPVASVQKPVPIVRILPDGRKATMIR